MRRPLYHFGLSKMSNAISWPNNVIAHMASTFHDRPALGRQIESRCSNRSFFCGKEDMAKTDRKAEEKRIESKDLGANNIVPQNVAAARK
ncbi:MAG: hypothetical protein C7B44_05815 [Sulfobacillus thermosulfidooxidans]|nr:MAG: hypothetical protein C7B44_05815 [Sulfobacillus thermosulfidooxidans]